MVCRRKLVIDNDTSWMGIDEAYIVADRPVLKLTTTTVRLPQSGISKPTMPSARVPDAKSCYHCCNNSRMLSSVYVFMFSAAKNTPKHSQRADRQSA